jgi:DNA polymerase-4
MRAASRAGRTVALRLRFDDFSRVTRSHTLPHTTSHTPTILHTVRALLANVMPAIEQRGVTLLGVSVGNLDTGDVLQLPLPFDRLSDGALDVALDGVHDRFGSASVTRAASLGQDPGWSVPMLPD